MSNEEEQTMVERSKVALKGAHVLHDGGRVTAGELGR